MRKLIGLALIAPLASCATTPPVTVATKMCMFHQKSLIVDDPRRSRNPVVTVRETPAASPAASPAVAQSGVQPGPTLILSGGSQNGAFGAGFLKRWAELGPDRQLPQFGLVTGISTGSILATWAFTGEPEKAAAEYAISQESQLLKVYRRPSKSGKIGIGEALTLLSKNSLADLTPLRDRLRTVFDYATLEKVAHRPGRLVIAAVEVDTGSAVLFDMKEMAARATGYAATSPEFAQYRDCYAEAVLASSSVPLGAKPVFIDNRMYIDGGARYGVFVDYLSNASAPADATSEPAAPAPAPLPDAPTLYILVNGTQWVKANCGKIDTARCGSDLDYEPDKIDNRQGGHRPWDIAALAFRSNDILINQVYRLSAARVQAQYQLKYPSHKFTQHFYFQRMHRSDLWHAENFSFEGKSCQQWHDEDKATLRPFEFYPNYMRCLEAYGANQAEESHWYSRDAKSNFENYQAL